VGSDEPKLWQSEGIMSVLEISLLGIPQFRYAGDDCRVPLRKAVALVAYLAIDGAMHPRDELVALLWPEADERKGRMVLRTCLSVLRRTLAGTAGAPAILRVAANSLGIERSALVVDAHELASAAALAEQPTEPPGLRAQLERAIALYRGALLCDLTLPDAPEFETWILAQRAASHRHLSVVLARLAGLQEAAGDLQSSAATLGRWLQHDPLEDAACRQLIAVRLAAGDPASGVQAYEEYRARLAADLGVQPDLEVQALAERAAAATRRPEPQRMPRAFVSGSLYMPLVGRAAELVALRQRYAQVCAGRPQVVILEGEAGIGKSRLVHEFLAWAAAQGADVLEGRAVELGGAVPYLALVEALRPRVERENAPDDLIDGVWLARLARLLPELWERYPDLPAAAASDGEDAASLYEAVVRLIQALATQRPLVLFFDDLQWADAPTLSLVLYAARRWSQCGTRVLLLLASHAPVLGMVPALDEWLARVSHETYASRLSLGPLLEQSTIQLVELLGGPMQGQEAATAAQFGRWLHLATGGRPFCIQDLLLHLLEVGALRLRQVADEWLLDVGPVLFEPGRLSDVVPERLREIVRGQLARLEPPARELLMAGAALGNRFTFADLCGVAGVPEAVALNALDTLLRACLLHEERDAGWYGFCYDALRAAVYAQAGAARRCLYQKRAMALSGTGQTMPTPAQPELGAHSYEDGASCSSQTIPLHLVSTPQTHPRHNPPAESRTAGHARLALPAPRGVAETSGSSSADITRRGALHLLPPVGSPTRQTPPHRQSRNSRRAPRPGRCPRSPPA
jgi:DNA-binding SARP family transcriptional activator